METMLVLEESISKEIDWSLLTQALAAITMNRVEELIDLFGWKIGDRTMVKAMQLRDSHCSMFMKERD